MRITRIDLAGALEDGQAISSAFATISRTIDSDQIDVVILSPDDERTHYVQADCDEDIWSMAECLQEFLDGHVGTKSMIHDYYRVLKGLAD